jgi:hypothetical protein
MQISIEIAEKFYEQGRLNEAQEVCEQIVAGDPNDLIRHFPDNLQICGDHTQIAPPSEWLSPCWHPMA